MSCESSYRGQPIDRYYIERFLGDNASRIRGHVLEIGYDRYTMIEAQGFKSGDIDDTVRFMKFYKALWAELSRPA